MSINLSEDVLDFMSLVRAGDIDLYNEFSFQHEIGLFLRGRHPRLRVQFERNVSAFFDSSVGFTKREIDITVFDAAGALKLALELKFPRRGQYPEQMFSFCKDIAFAEELVRAGFEQAAALVLVDDPCFYRGRAEGIYAPFRSSAYALEGVIQRPTGDRSGRVELRGRYQVEWRTVLEEMQYALFHVIG